MVIPCMLGVSNAEMFLSVVWEFLPELLPFGSPLVRWSFPSGSFGSLVLPPGSPLILWSFPLFLPLLPFGSPLVLTVRTEILFSDAIAIKIHS